jgi:catechol 2,3-dioxygenase-like lactoylglutathione lyase family enzyme
MSTFLMSVHTYPIGICEKEFTSADCRIEKSFQQKKGLLWEKQAGRPVVSSCKMNFEVYMKTALLRLIALLIPIMPIVLHAQDQPPAKQIKSTAEIMTHPMNVFRRFSGDAKPIYDFYGKVLGLKQLTTFNVGGNTNVARFEFGATQLKFTTVVPNRKYQHTTIPEATGLRLLTFFFPEQAPLIERFKANGLPVPEFRPLAGSARRSALVQDPSQQWVELVIAPNEPEDIYSQIEIGLVVSDIEVSRKFYREFVGLEELPAVKDPVFNTTKYPYRRGSVIVSLRCFGKPVPADTGSGGIQYVVSDVKAVQDLAEERRVKIDQPVNTLSGYGLRFIWLDDPDGITNYFAEIPATPAKKR